MSFLHILQTVFELFLILGVVWCFFNEDKLIAFEKGLVASFRRRRLRVVKTSHQTADI